MARSVSRIAADDFEMDGNEVSLSLPFAVPPTPPQPPEPEQRFIPPPSPEAFVSNCYEGASHFLYIERKPSRLFQYHAQPSPGDLKRIDQGRLRVISFTPNGLMEFRSDGSVQPVEDFRCCNEFSTRSRTTSTSTVSRRRGRRSAKKPESFSAISTSPLPNFDDADSSVGEPTPSGA